MIYLTNVAHVLSCDVLGCRWLENGCSDVRWAENVTAHGYDGGASISRSVTWALQRSLLWRRYKWRRCFYSRNEEILFCSIFVKQNFKYILFIDIYIFILFQITNSLAQKKNDSTNGKPNGRAPHAGLSTSTYSISYYLFVIYDTIFYHCIARWTLELVRANLRMLGQLLSTNVTERSGVVAENNKLLNI